MSGLNVIQTQESISAYIRSQFPGYTVYDDDIIDDQFVLKLGNKVKPYIVLNWGGLRSSQTGGSFVGARHDEYYSTVDVGVVAPVAKQSREALNIITDKLIGWKPLDSSPMTLEVGAEIFGIPDNSGKPAVYFSSARFRYNINTTNVGSYIQP